jgi:hypothetical protein
MGKDNFDDLFPDYSIAGKKKTSAEIKPTQESSKSSKSNQEVSVDLEDNWYSDTIIWKKVIKAIFSHIS